MKQLLILAFFALSVSNAFSQAFSDAVTAVTMLPSASAFELSQSAAATVLSPFISTAASIQARGVAGQEQLRDDLVALEEDMINGLVREIAAIRQPALKELFTEIAQDEQQMNEINGTIKSGTELHRIATAVSVELMLP